MTQRNKIDKKSKSVTDRQTNRPTDGWTDKAGCRVACTRLKRWNENNASRPEDRAKMYELGFYQTLSPALGGRKQSIRNKNEFYIYRMTFMDSSMLWSNFRKKAPYIAIFHAKWKKKTNKRIEQDRFMQKFIIDFGVSRWLFVVVEFLFSRFQNFL